MHYPAWKINYSTQIACSGRTGKWQMFWDHCWASSAMLLQTFGQHIPDHKPDSRNQPGFKKKVLRQAEPYTDFSHFIVLPKLYKENEEQTYVQLFCDHIMGFFDHSWIINSKCWEANDCKEACIHFLHIQQFHRYYSECHPHRSPPPPAPPTKKV